MESRSEPRLAGARAHLCALGGFLQVCTIACRCKRKCYLHIPQPAVQSFHPESQVKWTDNSGGRSVQEVSPSDQFYILPMPTAPGQAETSLGAYQGHSPGQRAGSQRALKPPGPSLSLLAAGPWALQTTSHPVIFQALAG